jgi:hypothetical protein
LAVALRHHPDAVKTLPTPIQTIEGHQCADSATPRSATNNYCKIRVKTMSG